MKKKDNENWLGGFVWQNIFGQKQKSYSVFQCLSENTIFANLTKSELRWLENLIHIRTYQAGEEVFHQDERGLGMYIIFSGKIVIRTSKKSQNHEQMQTITTLEQGSFFGEQALIDRESVRTASAYAVEPTKLIAFLKPDLNDIIQRKPSLGSKILYQISRVLSKRLRHTTTKLTELSIESDKPAKPSEKAA